MMTIMRSDYIEYLAKFEEYYREIYKEAGIDYTNDPLLPRVIAALNKGDEHLNTIPLKLWDTRAICSERCLRAVFKEHGDFYTLAGGVCAHKQAACDAAQLHRGMAK